MGEWRGRLGGGGQRGGKNFLNLKKLKWKIPAACIPNTVTFL